MEKTAQLVAMELQKISDAMDRLRDLGVIRSQKVVSDIGEWLSAALLGGKLAESKNQKGWDVICGRTRIQVRTHAKAEVNKNRATKVADVCDGANDLMIVVLSQAFRIKQIFHVPNRDVKELSVGGKLSWSRIQEFEVNPADVDASELRLLFAGSTS